MRSLSHLWVVILPALCVALTSGARAPAQTGVQWSPEPSSLCGRDNALALVRQQLDASKALNDDARRVAVMLRAADLLWPYRQDEAREVFSAAFDAAKRDFKEKGDAPRREGLGLLVDVPDQRYVVIRAVARRDQAWAKRLTEEVLKADAQEAETSKATSAAAREEADLRTAAKLLEAAYALLPADPQGAAAFAANSLKFPAGMPLTMFMYRLAEVDQKTADRFYRQALAAYGERPAREFLYLSAYPFGLNETGDMPWSGGYLVPPAFAPDPALKRLFVQTLLRRANQALQVPPDEGDNYNGFPGTGHILQVLTRLEPLVRRDLPDLAGASEQARNNLLSSLSQPERDAFQRSLPAQTPPAPQTFDERVEAAEREASKRDYLLSEAILDAGPAENAERVAAAADKIGDAQARAQLLDWFYFGRAQAAVKSGQLEEATRLASKVEEMDQRAYLYSEIAKASLPKLETQNQARVLLDEIVATAAKRPDSVVAARALFAAAYMYSKFDTNRALAVMAEAVKSVNSVEAADFSQQDIFRKIEGKNFGYYASFRTPGFDPENAFREMAKVDFDGALSLAGTLADKALRARTTLALAEFCLQRAAEQEKQERQKAKGKGQK
ncbi:MAG: hypothetical protein JOZ02_22485 [Acidobacteria bacterium]|nr:hypothetical protein [Acidobacteriota bacterium]